MQALLLPLGADLYALALTAVREVLPTPPLTPVPGAPRTVCGLFNLRGEVVPLFDTGALLGLDDVPPGTHVVVAASEEGPAGLTVDALPSRIELGDDVGPPELTAAIGRFAVGDRVVTLLDLEALVGRMQA